MLVRPYRRTATSLVVACLLTAGVAGCGRATALAADSEAFAGLDPVVVQEVLANPVAQQKIEEEPAATRESMAQGIVRNFLVCRDAHRVYDAWITTGEAPDLAPLPQPTSPREPSHADWATGYQRLRDRIDSGEVQQLRAWLTGEGSCGRWIPDEPGDVSGPTIADAVEAAA